MFSQVSGGSHCTVNALCEIIFAKFSHLQTKQNLDQVLLHGDKLYNKLCLSLTGVETYCFCLDSLSVCPSVCLSICHAVVSAL